MIFGDGIVGEEPVRSQGHIHVISPSCNASTCEVYEIWLGEAYIYMQETARMIREDVTQFMQKKEML